MKSIVVGICVSIKKDLETRRFYKRCEMTRIPRPGDLFTLENGVCVRVAVSSFNFATGAAESLGETVELNSSASWPDIQKKMAESEYVLEHDSPDRPSEACRVNTWVSRISKIIDIYTNH